jgi:amidophosphoribosyltransferase
MERIPREECGIVGIYGAPEAAKLAYLSLYALQHRGQESAGIVATDGQKLRMHKEYGLVADIFSEDVLDKLTGQTAIGHVRYSTTGSSQAANAQPLMANYHGGSVAVAHNGNLTNSAELRQTFERRGAIFQTTTDSEIFLHLIAHSSAADFHEALMLSLMRIKGAFSSVLLRPDRLIALRDPRGIRPLVLGKLGDAHIVASETCAFDIIGAEYIREVKPGEIITFDANGMHSEMPFAQVKPAFCVFENIYYSRPDSIAGDGRTIYEIRLDLGRELAREYPIEADVIIGVPDSAIPAAMGYAKESGIPFEMGLIRNHYVGRTFIEPQQSIRDFGARVKYNAVRGVLRDKNVIIVDDSIVRGTTAGKIVAMVRRAGAKKVHMLSSAPPWVHPCYYGVDTPNEDELIASRLEVEEIRKLVKCDSLGYLSIEGLEKIMPQGTSYCQACFDGKYIVGKPAKFVKEMLEV